jgi:hypothetical protein
VSYYSANKPSRISIAHKQCKDLIKRLFTMSGVRRASNGPSGFTHKNGQEWQLVVIRIPRVHLMALLSSLAIINNNNPDEMRTYQVTKSVS